jgi:hypothetical protein
MYKNVQVNHYNNATSTTTTPFSSSSSSSFPSQPNQTATSLPVQLTSASSSSFSSSTPNTRPSVLPNSNIGVSKISDGGISLPVSFTPANENMSVPQSSKLKSDVDQLDDLVKDLLIEVNRPLGTNTNNRSNNNNNKSSTSSSSYSYHRRSNNDNNEISNSKLPSSLRASSYTQASTLNNQKRNDYDANTVSGLIDGSLLSSNGIQREVSKSTREERIRVKRGGGGGGGGIGTEIPVTSSSSITTTTTTNKPAQTASSRDQLSIDEQLIDSLLESVQNTLRKRSQHQSHQTAWTTDIPIHQQHPANNRRTYSSSAAYTDSVHRVSKQSVEIIISHTLSLF